MTAPAGADLWPRRRLRILATTDLHMQLVGFDYCADRPEESGALTRLAHLIALARTEAEAEGADLLLLDNGDALQGTPMGDVAATLDGVHPLMQAFAHLRYDAIGLGNHDFSFGIPRLERILNDAPCPVICSNLDRLDPSLLPQIRPETVLQRGPPEAPIRIGVFSVIPPQTVLWEAEHLQGRVVIDDILACADRRARALKAQGCDLVLALAHTGLDRDSAEPGMENAAIPLAALPAIDVMIAGHTHLRLPHDQHPGLSEAEARAGRVKGKPVVMPGAYGSHLGVIDLELELAPDPAAPGSTAPGSTAPDPAAPAARRRWQLRQARTALRAAAAVPEEPVLRRRLAPHHDTTRVACSIPAGHSRVPLHSHFALIGHDRALAMVAAAQAAALRPLVAGTEHEGLPILSAAAPAKCGGRGGPRNFTDVPAGPLTQRHIADLCPYPNDLRAVIVNGAQIRAWLEQAAALFHRIAPGTRAAELVDRRRAAHDFDVLFGLDYVIDLSQPDLSQPDQDRADQDRADQNRADHRAAAAAATTGRIRALCHDGRPVRPDQRFIVAISNYRVSGGGNFAALYRARELPLPRMPVRDVLNRYLQGSLPSDPLERLPMPWRFAPVPGSSALLRTGPAARAHLSELHGRGIEDRGLDEDGFLQLLLPLDPPVTAG